MKKTIKTFIGGCVIGALVGALIGGYTVAVIMGSAFITYSLKQDEIRQVITNPLGQKNLNGNK